MINSCMHIPFALLFIIAVLDFKPVLLTKVISSSPGPIPGFLLFLTQKNGPGKLGYNMA